MSHILRLSLLLPGIQLLSLPPLACKRRMARGNPPALSPVLFSSIARPWVMEKGGTPYWACAVTPFPVHTEKGSIWSCTKPSVGGRVQFCGVCHVPQVSAIPPFSKLPLHHGGQLPHPHPCLSYATDAAAAITSLMADKKSSGRAALPSQPLEEVAVLMEMEVAF